MFAKVNNGQLVKYPYTLGMLRKENPNVSFPKNISDQILDQFNVVRVISTPRPEFDHTKDFSVTAEHVVGGWKEKWVATDLSAEAIANRTSLQETLIREQRDQLLSDSDWTQVADVPVNKTEWATYRQALRDVPSQDGFPWSVNWPTKP